MAYSTQRAVSNGSLGQLALALDYFDRSEISVFFNGVVSPAGSGKWSWVGTTDKTINFTPAVANGVEVMVQRSTQIAEPLHQYTKGAQFIAETLDENFKQVLRIAQEAREGSGAADVYNDLDFHGFRVKNIGAAVVDTDAVSLGQYKADAAGANAAKTAAQTSASNAATSETNALGYKNAAATSAANANTSATNAATSESNALSYKNAANTSAGNASTSATNAATSATNAATSESNALASKNAAATSAASVVRNGSGGVVGLTGFWIDVFDTATGTVKSRLSTLAASVARTWTLPDKSGAVALTSDILDATVQTINGGQLAGLRNMMINGDMRIDQRGNGAAGYAFASTNYGFAMDRWGISNGASGTLNVKQDTDVPTNVGFLNSALITATAASTLAASDGCIFYQNMEGWTLEELGWGTASAKPATLSFWVKASITGNYGIGLRNDALTRYYIAQFNVPVANTWTLVSITIPGCTDGVWQTGNNRALYLTWDLGCGANNNQPFTGAWAAGNQLGLTGGVKMASVLNATLRLTGVQWERGSTATPFERRTRPLELSFCQRYLQWMPACMGRWQGSTTNVAFYCGLPVPMRAAPTVSYVGSINVEEFNIAFRTVTGISGTGSSPTSVVGTLLATGTNGNSGGIPASSAGNGVLLNAEI